ncbi:predicted protein [Arabidopsis lyrata subsp. lyrata]|uniref:non-specific serine/threonine protein kinase n=1 Tax=Arabidopsis lyrata subsp. lyrata TaxID=81972 RepID=D7MKY6_ARALL|nr:predicted protein [Arabidopsis lyrata subsp. lyrata]
MYNIGFNKIVWGRDQNLDNFIKSLSNSSLLNFLAFDGNLLEGVLPESIGNLSKNLSKLFMGGNRFTDKIPESIGNLTGLTLLNMSDNSLTGVPQEIRNLKGLQVLELGINQLVGRIPDSLGDLGSLNEINLYISKQSRRFDPAIVQKLQEYLQALKFLNLSFNNLEGRIPNGGIFKDSSNVFMEGNPKLCIHAACRKTRMHGKLLKAIISTCAVGVIAICVITFLILKRKARKSITSTSSSSLLKEPFMNVSYDELRRATENFNPRNILGFGSFGSVFKGIIGGADVAVKVIDLKAHGYYKGFIAECEALRNVRHRNLVKLITSCSSIDFKNTEFLALVYEFLINGSLEGWIKGKKVNSDGSVGLSLEERVNIAIDIASALDYLHNDCEVPVVHCDLKPSNILLNEEMVAKVGDFGLARVLFDASDGRCQASISSTHVLKGSIGYIPPEYGLGEKPSQAGDVYSFGVMLLELFSGKSPMDESFEGDQSLVKWISYGFQNNAIMEVIDPNLKGLMDNICGAQLHTKIDCLNKIVEVGLACTAYAAGERMNMRDVLRILKSAKGMLVKGH